MKAEPPQKEPEETCKQGPTFDKEGKTQHTKQKHNQAEYDAYLQKIVRNPVCRLGYVTQPLKCQLEDQHPRPGTLAQSNPCLASTRIPYGQQSMS